MAQSAAALTFTPCPLCVSPHATQQAQQGDVALMLLGMLRAACYPHQQARNHSPFPRCIHLTPLLLKGLVDP